MELPEQTGLLFQRIGELEPEHASTIIEYIILNIDDHDVIRLAFSPDTALQSLIDDAKIDLGLTEMEASEPISDPFLQFSSYPHDPSSRLLLPQFYSDLDIQNQMQFLSLEDQLEPVNPGVGVGANRRSVFPIKVCHYFSKGYCKHGSKCWYFHGQVVGENRNVEHRVTIRGKALEKLEMEIIELLKSRQGIPISIAALPIVYYENYGRNLHADGYHTESQRVGRPGLSLTKLLSSLNSVCVLDRPYGQHSVILAEDAGKYMEFSDNNARQIYITFPASSTFTEQDVSNYFSKYGPVQDVKIPFQLNKVYGFVTFIYAETAKHILSIRTTHLVCGVPVLAKPYREKLYLFLRKNAEKLSLPVGYIREGDQEEPRLPRLTYGSLRRNLIDENDHQQQHSELLVTPRNSPHLPYLAFSTNESARSSELPELRDLSSTDQQQHDFPPSSTDRPDDSTQELNLPDSPFAAPTTR